MPRGSCQGHPRQTQAERKTRDPGRRDDQTDKPKRDKQDREHGEDPDERPTMSQA